MITMTAKALAEVRGRLDALASEHRTVRLATTEGGCSGTKYTLKVGVPAESGDRHWDQAGVRILCPANQLGMLRGLQVDFVTAFKGGGFRFINPNVGSTCGCGRSFKPLVNLA